MNTKMLFTFENNPDVNVVVLRECIENAFFFGMYSSANYWQIGFHWI